MPEAHAVTLVDEIQVRIDLHHVNVAAAFEGIDAGNVDRVVTAEDDGQRTGIENGPDPGFYIGVALDRIGVHDVGVADVGELEPALGQIGDVVLVVVGAGVTEREQGRGFANAARALACAGPPLRAEVERCAEHGNVGVDLVPVQLQRPLAERANADKRQIEAAALITVTGHNPFPILRNMIGFQRRILWPGR